MIKFYYPNNFLNDIEIPKGLFFTDINNWKLLPQPFNWYAIIYPTLINSLLILLSAISFNSNNILRSCWYLLNFIILFTFFFKQFYSDFLPTIPINCFRHKSPDLCIADYNGQLSLVLYSSLKDFLHWLLSTISWFPNWSLLFLTPLLSSTCKHWESLRGLPGTLLFSICTTSFVIFPVFSF